MSKRSDRRAAERETNKLAQQQLRQPSPAVAQIPESLNPATPVSDVPVPAVATTTTSEAQIAANRANAQLSTGPTTEEGKAISARNNTRHGLAGDSDADNFRVLVTEKQSHYDQRLAGFRHEWKPSPPPNKILSTVWSCTLGCANAPFISRKPSSTRKPAKSPISRNSTSTAAMKLRTNAALTRPWPTSSDCAPSSFASKMALNRKDAKMRSTNSKCSA
jgi:hypothetical protein